MDLSYTCIIHKTIGWSGGGEEKEHLKRPKKKKKAAIRN